MKKSLLFLSLIASLSASAQWTSQATGFSDPSRGLSEIKIVDANTVWALAYDGSGLGARVQEFTRTTDGTSWVPGTIDFGNEDLDVNNLSPVSATTAWASAIINEDGGPTDGVGFIVKTEDGGLTWTPQLSEGFQEAGESFLNGVYFFNENDGLAYGDPQGGEFEVWRTTDGGDTWTRVPGASLPNPQSSEWGYNSSPTAVGNTLWFTTNKGRLYKTTDKGVTWTVHNAPITDFGGANQNGTIDFSTATNGCLLKNVVSGSTTTRTFYTTVDGGANWSTGALFTGTRFILTYIPGTTTIVATSQAAPVGTSISTNNGATWTEVESIGEQRGAAAFLNMNTGWTAGFSENELTDGIFKLTSPLANSEVNPTAKFKVYPNPASSVVTISTPDVESAKLNVTDLSGKIVMTRSLNGIENTVDISNLSTGAYFFELTSDSKKEVVKILKN